MTDQHTTDDSTTAHSLTDLDHRAITTARLLAMDSVERAGSGHPGTAIALAPVAHLIFQKHLRHSPTQPDWVGRDRFVLSCGHASILLYTQLFLTGYGLDIDDLRSFRAHESLLPGHPEYRHTAGVETTTGPLGQGFATAVGMAMAMKHEKALYEPAADARSLAAERLEAETEESSDAAPRAVESTDSIFDRTIWVLCSDGDMQEGISYEAGALAGRHRLDNLVVIFDDNDVQIEGNATLVTSEDTAARFRAQGWNVVTVPLAESGEVDTARLDTELAAAAAHRGEPSLIILKSVIAWPAPHARNTSAAHGSPLGEVEAEATRAVLGSTAAPFEVDDEVLQFTRGAQARGEELVADWNSRLDAYTSTNPERAADWARVRSGALPDGLADALPVFEPGETMATRAASGLVIQELAKVLPELWGGSADLAEPNRTTIEGGRSFLPEETESSGRAGRNVHWGVREHAMGAAMNGISLVDGSRFFAGTFLVFSDYHRQTVRLAALMKLPVIYLWSHDSVALGSDGPTHQPIEHLASLRAMPDFAVVRPADAAETAASWLTVLQNRGPAGIVLGRQPIATADTPWANVLDGVSRGAYVVREVPDARTLLIATGSEVALALAAAAELDPEQTSVRVVSMPCREWFEAQGPEYRESVLPAALTARVVVEAAASFGWHDIAGPGGRIVGIDVFGLSAPGDEALVARGMTVERVVAAAREATETAAAS
ncbi:transketolase [Subtercola sp. Z020]|uniref:transketolase family protein n=1 Tax=Subtercola sp. Z020 TaxID=2080582 RepID=UPI000CE7CE32|nr:transketolase [Subtercola sp. Z020]PPF90016.1 transketolase [Subtercola sp. Z020]